MRYQVMALASEMDGAMTISSISWQRGGSMGSASGNYNNFEIHLGLSSEPELTDVFEDNYIPGTRTLVYQTSSQTMSAGPDQWMTIPLDTPFWYNGTDNLVVEIRWVGGANMFYTYKWSTGADRALENKTDVFSPAGTLSQNMSELMFDGPLSLTRHSFGAIKALWTD
jgi:hypothetical protein